MVALWRRKERSADKQAISAIGNFDGLHLGHQKILDMTQRMALENNCIPVLVTFEPYPYQFFYPEKKRPQLTTLREKINFMQQKSCFMPEGMIYALPFDQSLALSSAEKFIREILLQKLKTKIVIVGEDFRFGYQRTGDVKLLKSCVETCSLEPVMSESARISSTRVREALSRGDLISAKKLLGRAYTMTGRVIRGHQRGRQLGFPTANIALSRRVPPLKGVYAVTAQGRHYGVANIGTRPTVDGADTFLEVYLFDFNQDIYGQYLTVEFLHKIRDEKRFESLGALKAQIAEDVSAAKKLLLLNK
jgi:riboflavin kinase/FMN adenylyltransferase